MGHHHLPDPGVELCHLFVYGTLRSGQPNSPRLGGAVLVGIGTVQGRLLHLGKYPGLVPGTGATTGELHQLPLAALGRIDALEGYDPTDPDGSLFQRVRLPVQLEDGSSIEAWTYVWPHGDEGSSPIEHGDWIRHLQETRSGQPPVPWLP